MQKIFEQKMDQFEPKIYRRLTAPCPDTSPVGKGHPFPRSTPTAPPAPQTLHLWHLPPSYMSLSTHKCTHKVTDPTDHPTHAIRYASMGRYNRYIKLWSQWLGFL